MIPLGAKETECKRLIDKGRIKEQIKEFNGCTDHTKDHSVIFKLYIGAYFKISGIHYSIQSFLINISSYKWSHLAQNFSSFFVLFCSFLTD